MYVYVCFCCLGLVFRYVYVYVGVSVYMCMFCFFLMGVDMFFYIWYVWGCIDTCVYVSRYMCIYRHMGMG